eukprot:g82023.t1
MSGLTCSECEEIPALFYCGECEQNMCPGCDTFFHGRGARAQHKRTSLESMCDECMERRAAFVCDACDQRMCPQCDATVHNKGKRLRHIRDRWPPDASAVATGPTGPADNPDTQPTLPSSPRSPPPPLPPPREPSRKDTYQNNNSAASPYSPGPPRPAPPALPQAAPPGPRDGSSGIRAPKPSPPPARKGGHTPPPSSPPPPSTSSSSSSSSSSSPRTSSRSSSPRKANTPIVFPRAMSTSDVGKAPPPPSGPRTSSRQHSFLNGVVGGMVTVMVHLTYQGQTSSLQCKASHQALLHSLADTAAKMWTRQEQQAQQQRWLQQQLLAQQVQQNMQQEFAASGFELATSAAAAATAVPAPAPVPVVVVSLFHDANHTQAVRSQSELGSIFGAEEEGHVTLYGIVHAQTTRKQYLAALMQAGDQRSEAAPALTNAAKAEDRREYLRKLKRERQESKLASSPPLAIPSSPPPSRRPPPAPSEGKEAAAAAHPGSPPHALWAARELSKHSQSPTKAALSGAHAASHSPNRSPNRRAQSDRQLASSLSSSSSFSATDTATGATTHDNLHQLSAQARSHPAPFPPAADAPSGPPPFTREVSPPPASLTRPWRTSPEKSAPAAPTQRNAHDTADHDSVPSQNKAQLFSRLSVKTAPSPPQRAGSHAKQPPSPLSPSVLEALAAARQSPPNKVPPPKPSSVPNIPNTNPAITSNFDQIPTPAASNLPPRVTHQPPAAPPSALTGQPASAQLTLAAATAHMPAKRVPPSRTPPPGKPPPSPTAYSPLPPRQPTPQHPPNFAENFAPSSYSPPPRPPVEWPVTPLSQTDEDATAGSPEPEQAEQAEEEREEREEITVPRNDYHHHSTTRFKAQKLAVTPGSESKGRANGQLDSRASFSKRSKGSAQVSPSSTASKSQYSPSHASETATTATGPATSEEADEEQEEEVKDLTPDQLHIFEKFADYHFEELDEEEEGSSGFALQAQNTHITVFLKKLSEIDDMILRDYVLQQYLVLGLSTSPGLRRAMCSQHNWSNALISLFHDPHAFDSYGVDLQLLSTVCTCISHLTRFPFMSKPDFGKWVEQLVKVVELRFNFSLHAYEIAGPILLAIMNGMARSGYLYHNDWEHQFVWGNILQFTDFMINYIFLHPVQDVEEESTGAKTAGSKKNTKKQRGNVTGMHVDPDTGCLEGPLVSKLSDFLNDTFPDLDDAMERKLSNLRVKELYESALKERACFQQLHNFLNACQSLDGTEQELPNPDNVVTALFKRPHQIKVKKLVLHSALTNYTWFSLLRCKMAGSGAAGPLDLNSDSPDFNLHSGHKRERSGSRSRSAAGNQLNQLGATAMGNLLTNAGPEQLAGGRTDNGVVVVGGGTDGMVGLAQSLGLDGAAPGQLARSGTMQGVQDDAADRHRRAQLMLKNPNTSGKAGSGHRRKWSLFKSMS